MWPGSAGARPVNAAAAVTLTLVGAGVGAAWGQGRGVQGVSCVLFIFAFFNTLLQVSEMLVVCHGNRV